MSMSGINTQSRQSVATNETGELIAASKVEGTTVYDRKGEKVGSVYEVMLEKRTGQVSYAVLSFGGFLGLGENYYPLPWEQLHYDTSRGGYVVDLDESRLRDAPSYRTGEQANWDDADYRRRVDDYYGLAPYGGTVI